MWKKPWLIARTEIPMVFKSRYVRMIPTILVIMSVIFGGVMTYFVLSWGITDAVTFSLMMASIMGVVIIMLPVMLPVMIAADSIVGEKERHTLVPLLSTPLTDGELLRGKILTALIPGLIVAYGNLVLAVGVVNGVVFLVAPSLLWVWPSLLPLIQAIVMPLLFSFLAVEIMVILSGRANTVYDAYQTGGVLILPAMLFGYSAFLQGTGLDWYIFIIGSIILLLLNLILYRVAVRLFNRDEFITRTG
jgi:ABC-type Na+ efflux pump permease subunit